MQNIITILQQSIANAVQQLYGLAVAPQDVKIESTNPTFEGDYTCVVFPYVRFSKKSPEATATEIGTYLNENVAEIANFNIVKGFLNLVVSDSYWTNFLHEIADNPNYGKSPNNGQRAVIEYSSPNTNKPLHLGHIRNILLGWSSIKTLETAGYDVIKTKVVNDRGIAICKSMLAWQLFGEGKTPTSTATKGDHFVGEYYVMFEGKFRAEYKVFQQSETGQALFLSKQKENQSEDEFWAAYKNQYFNDYSQLGAAAREMLLRWEAGDADTIDLWKRMNGWVYEGFNETYKKLGVNFDKIYYESDTYKLGKETIEKGLAEGIFYKKDDGSVWIDLMDAKLDHKVVLRGDGTSLYITQDIGMAPVRYAELKMDKMVFVVADEQNYHFQVLFEILKRLGEPYAGGMYHLSYGMVELPSGKMKSREGTVVDADDLVSEVIATAQERSEEVGVAKELAPDEKQEAIRKIGMAALKYHLLKVHPKKKMVFDPNESVDFQGQTGPYIQYNYVRAFGAINKGKSENLDFEFAKAYTTLEPSEKELITQLFDFPTVIQKSASEYDPSTLATYCYSLAKAYSKFWSDVSIFKAEDTAKAFRLQLSQAVANSLKLGMACLGIEMPDRM
jgi:arginyl-tRNA synthetase